jgi:hypothetical protein
MLEELRRSSRIYPSAVLPRASERHRAVDHALVRRSSSRCALTKDKALRSNFARATTILSIFGCLFLLGTAGKRWSARLGVRTASAPIERNTVVAEYPVLAALLEEMTDVPEFEEETEEEQATAEAPTIPES